MTKEVLIHMKSQQFPVDPMQSEEEPMEMIMAGEYYLRNGTHYFLYDEMMDGFTEPTHNILKIRPGLMEVRKKGVVNVNMIFENAKKNISYYHTPMGMIEMDIAATKVTMMESAKAIEIHAEYALGMNGSAVADCVMEIRVTPQNDKEQTTFFK